MRVTSWQAVIPVGMIGLILAGALGHVRIDAASPRAVRAVQSETIDHVKPKRDSSGPIPDRLEWTTVKGADSYSIGVWNEVDVMIWKQGNLKTNSVAWPKELVVDSGTYFWSVMAFRNGEPIAESGLAAFIVVR